MVWIGYRIVKKYKSREQSYDVVAQDQVTGLENENYMEMSNIVQIAQN